MFRKILVAFDTTASDVELLKHAAELASAHRSELMLLHVAEGWVARNFDHLNLAGPEEMREDWKYIEDTAGRIRAETGLMVGTRLGLGSPTNQILAAAESERLDLIAMASHGHCLLGDIIHGSTIDAVRHRATVPIIVVPPRR